MKCFVTHTGQNFEKSFGPFDSIQEAHDWLYSPRIKKLGIRGAITPMVPPYADLSNVWNKDEYEEAMRSEVSE